MILCCPSALHGVCHAAVTSRAAYAPGALDVMGAVEDATDAANVAGDVVNLIKGAAYDAAPFILLVENSF